MNNFESKNNNSLSRIGRGSQSGRSMIEMLGVLAIIGVLSVGGIAGYSKAMTKYRINKTIEQITLIAGNVRAFFAPQGNYDGMDSGSEAYFSVVKKAKLVPDEMLADTIITSPLFAGMTGKIQNIFGGVVQIEAQDREKEYDNKAFSIIYTDIPDEVCVELVTQDWSNAGAKAIEINRTNYTDGTEIADYFLPISVDKAVNVCETTGGVVPSLNFLFDSVYWLN